MSAEQTQSTENLKNSEKDAYDILEEKDEEIGGLEFEFNASYQDDREYAGDLPESGNLEDVKEVFSAVRTGNGELDDTYERWPTVAQMETSEEDPQVKLMVSYSEVNTFEDGFGDELLLEIEGYAMDDSGSNYKVDKVLQDD